jgi:transcription elongation factor Elf1
METQEIYAPSRYVLPDRQYRSYAVKIRIPFFCPACNAAVKVCDVGNPSGEGSLVGTCTHFFLWTRLWEQCKVYNDLCPQCGERHD